MPSKPLGHKSYGSIGHLPASRLGAGDHCVPEGQARICTVKTRDSFDRVIVQEKLDGSCTAVALIDGVIHPLGRAGWPAETSRYPQHKMFAEWVRVHEDRFRSVLKEDERLVGEWLAQAHGTIYHLQDREPWGVFDLMQGTTRSPFDELQDRIAGRFLTPHTLHNGAAALPIETALSIHETLRWPGDETEGIVYRVERRGKVEFLAKWVKPTKIDGKHLPEIHGGEAVWNWRPPWW